MLKRLLSLTGAACILLSAGTTATLAQSKIDVGTLTCTGEGGLGLIIGSKKSLSCEFKPVGQPAQSYTATITKIGVDVGVTGKTVLAWTVLGPSATTKPKALTGEYVGAAANVSVGVGGGANLLVGGFDKSFVLQPLSMQGQTGINLAIGIAGLTLN